ncbi:hypothetical protein AAE478_007948 [Parahypoxylon ruwenzoriense]
MASSANHRTSPLPYPLETTIPAGPSPGPSEGDRSHHLPQHGEKKMPARERISTDNDDPYAFLKHFNTVFLIDDSASMEPYWPEVGALLEKIAPICIEHDRNGIDIFFVNHRPRGYFAYSLIDRGLLRMGYRNIGLMDGVREMRDNVTGILAGVKPRGKCKLDRSLGRILDHYVGAFHTMQVVRPGLSDGKVAPRRIMPLNLIVVTDGIVDDNPNDSLIRTARKLDEMDAPPDQVGVQFFRVGDDGKARQAMDATDDLLSDALDVRDMVDTTTWSGKPGELSPDAVLKVVLGAVERSIDKVKI